jgi:hypothetical protein
MYGEGFFEKKFDLSKNPDEVSRFDGNFGSSKWKL